MVNPMEFKTQTHLAGIIEQNIQTILELRIRALEARSAQERISDSITAFCGRISFLYLHAIWFGVWIIVNLGWTGLKPFDSYPFGLLTMIVSLEAIFLAAFVLISQNRTAAEADHRADLDLQINLLTEHEITRVLRLLDAIGRKLEVDVTDSELAQLEVDVAPQAVLQEMDLAQHRVRRPGKMIK
jgi:uncharacterized membrane protein